MALALFLAASPVFDAILTGQVVAVSDGATGWPKRMPWDWRRAKKTALTWFGPVFGGLCRFACMVNICLL
jgi:hypothetical protein